VNCRSTSGINRSAGDRGHEDCGGVSDDKSDYL
jgi:hypothetical protein